MVVTGVAPLLLAAVAMRRALVSRGPALLGLAVALLLVPPLLLVMVVRSHDARLLRPLLAWQRRSLNPHNLRTAGTAGSSWSVVRHVGRLSGSERATPVGAEPVPGGFRVLLPYGSGTQWARNVLAAGEAVLEHRGETHRVVRPRVVPVAEVRRDLSRADRWVARVFGITEVLLVDTVDL